MSRYAKIRLKALLERANPDDPSVGLRLGKTASGALGVCPDRGRADDEIVEHEGVVVLLVGQGIAARMEDRTIDYDERGPDRRLVVT
jgi:Fe-S cluster assembly iron-binding protein IscA